MKLLRELFSRPARPVVADPSIHWNDAVPLVREFDKTPPLARVSRDLAIDRIVGLLSDYRGTSLSGAEEFAFARAINAMSERWDGKDLSALAQTAAVLTADCDVDATFVPADDIAVALSKLGAAQRGLDASGVVL